MRFYYRCPECGATYPIEPGIYLCPICSAKSEPGRPPRGVLEVVHDGTIGVAPWLAAAAHGITGIPLPVEEEWFPPIPVGETPLWAPERLRTELGLPNLYLKDDTANPTGSLKDRASFLVAAFARKFMLKEVALASTGNAASSMSGVGAAAGLSITVFLPKTAPKPKRIQVLQYGARLIEVDGTYDVAFDHCLEYCAKTGVLSRNTAHNPLTIEGKKTVSYEIVRDLSRTLNGAAGDTVPRAKSPDYVFVPTGDGVIISGVFRGFEDMVADGVIDRMPTIVCVQAEGSSSIARALGKGSFGEPVPSRTVADSISVDIPRNGLMALAKLKKHGGKAVTVSDAEILAAQRLLASRAGLFAEPSSSAALAGLLKLKAGIDPGATVVLLVTGSGLKDIEGATKALELN